MEQPDSRTIKENIHALTQLDDPTLTFFDALTNFYHKQIPVDAAGRSNPATQFSGIMNNALRVPFRNIMSSRKDIWSSWKGYAIWTWQNKLDDNIESIGQAKLYEKQVRSAVNLAIATDQTSFAIESARTNINRNIKIETSTLEQVLDMTKVAIYQFFLPTWLSGVGYSQAHKTLFASNNEIESNIPLSHSNTERKPPYKILFDFANEIHSPNRNLSKKATLNDEEYFNFMEFILERIHSDKELGTNLDINIFGMNHIICEAFYARTGKEPIKDMETKVLSLFRTFSDQTIEAISNPDNTNHVKACEFFDLMDSLYSHDYWRKIVAKGLLNKSKQVGAKSPLEFIQNLQLNFANTNEEWYANLSNDMINYMQGECLLFADDLRSILPLDTQDTQELDIYKLIQELRKISKKNKFKVNVPALGFEALRSMDILIDGEERIIEVELKVLFNDNINTTSLIIDLRDETPNVVLDILDGELEKNEDIENYLLSIVEGNLKATLQELKDQQESAAFEVQPNISSTQKKRVKPEKEAEIQSKKRKRQRTQFEDLAEDEAHVATGTDKVLHSQNPYIVVIPDNFIEDTYAELTPHERDEIKKFLDKVDLYNKGAKIGRTLYLDEFPDLKILSIGRKTKYRILAEIKDGIATVIKVEPRGIVYRDFEN